MKEMNEIKIKNIEDRVIKGKEGNNRKTHEDIA
jgi:hypothetical protein